MSTKRSLCSLYSVKCSEKGDGKLSREKGRARDSGRKLRFAILQGSLIEPGTEGKINEQNNPTFHCFATACQRKSKDKC